MVVKPKNRAAPTLEATKQIQSRRPPYVSMDCLASPAIVALSSKRAVL